MVARRDQEDILELLVVVAVCLWRRLDPEVGAKSGPDPDLMGSHEVKMEPGSGGWSVIAHSDGLVWPCCGLEASYIGVWIDVKVALLQARMLLYCRLPDATTRDGISGVKR
jgi:hypothetical protein